MVASLRRRAARVAALATACTALAAPSTASAWGLNDLAGWWPMVEGRGQTVYDWSGHGNHGTLGSTPQADANDPKWIRGFFGLSKGLDFDGNDYVTIPGSPDLESPKVTVGVWFRAPASPGAHKYLVGKGASGCDFASWGLTTHWNGGLSFYAWDGSRFAARSGLMDQSIWDGRWHHAAGTFDGVDAKLFIDGKEIVGGWPSETGEIDYDVPNGATGIGSYVEGCDLAFAGSISNVRIWRDALPVRDIWARWAWLLGRPTGA